MARKRKQSRFIDSVPELIQKVRSFKDRTISNPEVPFPWPPYVPKPEILENRIAYVDGVYQAIGDEKIRTGGRLEVARKSVKTVFSQLVGHVAVTLEGEWDVAKKWPGFDQGRNPGECRCRAPYRSAAPAGKKNGSD